MSTLGSFAPQPAQRIAARSAKGIDSGTNSRIAFRPISAVIKSLSFFSISGRLTNSFASNGKEIFIIKIVMITKKPRKEYKFAFLIVILESPFQIN